MLPLHLDAFCQRVIYKRKVFTCKENFDINLLMEHEEQSSHLMDVIVDKLTMKVKLLSSIGQYVKIGKKASVRCLG